jgi:putative tryptophan/tyrosine transport system substrate-binding protein
MLTIGSAPRLGTIYRGLTLAVVLALGLFFTPLAIEAQQAVRVYRIGTLSVSSAESGANAAIAAFEERLRELGYVKGSNVIYEHRFAGGRMDRLPELANELAALNLDVILAGANPAIAAARRAMPRIPIVMGYGIDPVGVGFVASLARPGGNITGVTFDVTADTWGKRLQLAKEIAPLVSHVAVLWNPDAPGMSAAWKATEDAAATLGVKLQWVAVRRPEDFDAGFTAIALRRPGALLIFADPITYTRRREIIATAARQRVPAIYAIREATDEGGLMSYGVSNLDLYRRAAYFVDRILKGAKPSELPVEQPTKLELVINLKTARTLGLTIPPPLLLQADEVIE